MLTGTPAPPFGHLSVFSDDMVLPAHIETVAVAAACNKAAKSHSWVPLAPQRSWLAERTTCDLGPCPGTVSLGRGGPWH